MAESTDFFSGPSLSTNEEDSYQMIVRPMSSIDNAAPLTYVFSTDNSHYCDMSSLVHFLKVRLMKKDRTTQIPPPAGDNADGNGQKVAPINYFSNTLFSSCDTYLNQNLVQSSNNLYGYLSFFQSFLSFGQNVKKNQMAAAGFYADSGEIDTNALRTAMNLDTCGNKGLRERYKLSRCSKVMSVVAPLHIDLCAQNRYLLNRTEVKIRLTRAEPKFGLISNDSDDFSYVIDDAYLMVRMVRPAASLRTAVEELLEQPGQMVKYPYKSSECRFYSFSGGSTTLAEPNLYTGPLPVRIAFGLVDTTSFNGDFKTSPLNFKHYSVTDTDLKINGESINNEPMRINMDNDDYIAPYFWMYRNTGGYFDNEAIISYEQFKNGYFIYVYDLTVDSLHARGLFHPPRSGTISLDIRLKEAPDVPVTLIVMMEIEKILYADKDRKFTLAG